MSTHSLAYSAPDTFKDAGITKVSYIEAYPIEEAVDYLKQNNIDIDAFEGFKPRRFNQVFRQLE